MVGILIEIANSSGFGKSVLAAKIYRDLAINNKDVQFIQETIKKVVYISDLFYPYEVNKLHYSLLDLTLLTKVADDHDFVVYDASALNPVVYEDIQLQKIDNFYGHFHKVITLRIKSRQIPYNLKGRFENEATSDEYNAKFEYVLTKLNRNYILVEDVNYFDIMKHI